METRQTNPDMNRDDLQRPDRAKSDELGRTSTGDRARKASPREQPAKAVHLGGTGKRTSKPEESGSQSSISNRGDRFMKKAKPEEFEADEDLDTE